MITMSSKRTTSPKERVGLIVAALIVTGVGLLGEPMHIPLYLLDILGTLLLLVCSGGEAADGLPFWLSALIAGLVNVGLYYYLFKLIVYLWKGWIK